MKRKPSRVYLIEVLGGKCKKCGSNSNLEIDHIIPISKGGKEVFGNLQLLCENCHYEKTYLKALIGDFWCEKCEKVYGVTSYLDLGREEAEVEFWEKNHEITKDEAKNTMKVIKEWVEFSKKFENEKRRAMCPHYKLFNSPHDKVEVGSECQ